MFLRHDFVSTTLGGHTWFEKPSLLYWMMMAGYRVFGVGEHAARIGPALSGLLTGVFVYWIGSTIESLRTAAGSSVNSEAPRTEPRRDSLAGWTTLILLRREMPPRRFVKSLLWGIPLALAVAAVWYGPIIHRHGWKFIDEFIIQHHFARYLTNKYHHPEPFYFYGPVLIAYSFPWTIFLAAAFISARRWKWRGGNALDRLRVLAFVWVIVPLIFFSLSGSKLTTYILPVLPAATLLIGDRITQFLGQQRGDTVIRLTGLFLISLAVFGGGYLAHGFPGSS